MFAIFIFEVDFSETYLMTSAENSVLEPPNLEIVWWRIPPGPPTRLLPSALAVMPLPPVTKNLATALLVVLPLHRTSTLPDIDAALKILFFEILQDLGLVDSVPPWYSPLKPKPVYETNNAQGFWDVPLFAEHQEVRANRVDARIINHESKRVITLEMSCPWVTSWEEKEEGKTTKYGPLRWELKQKHQGYEEKQYNMIMDDY